ncbi:GMP synthase [glutamine-hydrolyzing] [Aquicella siphonis]|uniref:GMP synthase [glutamine-hydrolyzing] n=1 Tax=Aquicella siphonis TaxID=254247 RepID=A0A5E4PIU5_9COXI|nr:homoserine O-succinyltransferase [Aquicella siphonis]VVC76990.1 GMP synthase [glutamine-hydrolyzing] [Aquicella siphonis]
MHIHYIIHAPFEKLGTIESWINKNQFSVSGTHVYRGEDLPAVEDFDFLIIMGGPQSALMLEKFPYLQAEVDLIQSAIAANKAILGICLGAQLLGIALGAKAEPSPHREIGVYPVEATPEASSDPLFKQFPGQFDVMHWHSDMPGLPDKAVLLAKSAGCPRQAFRYGDRVYGFQFHLELTPENIKEMVRHCQNELSPGKYVQKSEELIRSDLSGINLKMHKALDHLADCMQAGKSVR